MSIRYMAKTDSYIHRSVAETDILVSIGRNIEHHNGFIEINKTAAFLWELLQKPCTVDEMTIAFVEKYDVEKSIALQDIKELLIEMKEHGMVTTSE